MIAVSFLGTGNYSEIIYKDSDTQSFYKTKYFAEALYHIYKPDIIYLVSTVEAKQKHFTELSSKIEFEEIIIPTGKTNDEIWQMFSDITERIPQNAEIIIDITHGFRSQPMIALSIAIFLRIVKNVKINKIIYGAYEAKEDDVAPIFNITSFVYLIDWSYATEQFIRNGKSEFLSNLLNEIHNKIRIEQNLFSNLKSFATSIDKITESLMFIRPQELSQHSKELPNKLDKIRNDIIKIPEIKPLQYLLNKIPESFSSLVTEDKNIFSEAGFKMQTEMIKYYIETQQFVQAITLAREFMVSLICKKFNLDFIKKEGRSKAEDLLNEWAASLIKKEVLNEFESKFASLWCKIRDARNDINHAGMKESVLSANLLKKNIHEYCLQTIELLDYAYQPIKSPEK